MADLPRRQRSEASISVPQSSFNAAHIATPYKMVASALSQVGDDLEQAAVEQAKVEGQSAVARDENGNLTVERRDMLTASGRAYNRSANTAYIARMNGEVRSKIGELRREANEDPATFDAMMKAFRRDLLSKQDKAHRGAVELLVDTEAQSARDGLISTKHRRDLKENEEAIKSEIGRLDRELAAIAHGGGTELPAYAEKLAQLKDLYGELVDNPAFTVSKQEADNAFRGMESRHVAESLQGHVERVAKEQGIAAAAKEAERVFWDPELDLTPAERRQYQSIAEGTLRDLSSGVKAEVKALKASAKQLEDLYDAGGKVDDETTDAAISELAKRGAATEALRLSAARARSRVLRSFSLKTDDEQARDLEAAAGGGMGYEARVVAVESSGRADAKASSSSATGLHQFTAGTWLDYVQRHRPEWTAGKSRAEILELRKDPERSSEIFRIFTNDNAQYLKNRSLPTTQANLYLSHFFGAGDAVRVLKADANTPVSNIVSKAKIKANPFLKDMSAGDVIAWAAGKMGRPVDPKVLKAMRSEVEADAKSLWGDVKTGLSKGLPPRPGDIALLRRDLSLVEDEDFRSEVNAYLDNLPALSEFAQGAIYPQSRELEGMRAAGADAGFGGPGADLFDTMQKIHERTRTMLDSDPIALGVERGIIAAPEPPDFSSPDTFGASMAARQRLTDRLGAHYGREDFPAMTVAETDLFNRAFKTATPAEQAAYLGALSSNLSPQTFSATVGKLFGKDTDSAVAIAAGVQDDAPAVAESILRGRELLRANPRLAWKNDTWTQPTIDESLPSSAFAPGLARARASFIDAVRARYADASDQAGDTSQELNNDRLEAAVTDVTGGLVDLNGHKVLTPEYGMGQDGFERRLKNLGARALQGAQALDGTPFTLSDLQRDGYLFSVADGRYLIRFGDAETGSFVVGPDGEPFELDLRERRRPWGE